MANINKNVEVVTPIEVYADGSFLASVNGDVDKAIRYQTKEGEDVVCEYAYERQTVVCGTAPNQYLIAYTNAVFRPA